MPGVFDIIGPVMVGPSSSHTAGAIRLGKMARAIFGGQPDSATIILHGSFARTHKGHGTDRGIVGGLLDFGVDDERIAIAFQEAEKAGMQFVVRTDNLGEDVHPNAARVLMQSGGHSMTVTGCSVGGGQVLITEIDGYPVNLKGDAATLILPHKDAHGMVAQVTSVLANHRANIASMSSLRESRGEDALMVISVDGDVTDDTIREINRIKGIYKTMLVEPLEH
ncbi:MAG: L-serine ammonia-lyase, iron-sulfur-dependent, subunit beta [Planctomycetes bacterium]|nr:L-serine ammonia-lyase, iron-sulfur-dependent, subunit beta [Planctomycetota bacterium]